MKTWMMIRDIREGETYEATDEQHYYVTCVRGDVRYSGDREAELSRNFMSKSWRKRPALVDFAEAFAAYERGARIVSENNPQWTYAKSDGGQPGFYGTQIRGKWIIEEGDAI